MASKQEIKERGIRIGVNQIITYATLVPIFLFVAQPLLIDAMAEDIKQLVAEEVQPISNAFVALLQLEINAARKDIAALKFRERQAEDWTSEDASDLADMEIQLDALEEAKTALQVDNTS